MQWLLVALGGAVGTVFRFALAKAAAEVSVTRVGWFPWGTFTANLCGSFLLGLIFVAGEGKTILGVDARVVLGTGVMGGFTTYSTFNLETLRTFEQGQLGRGLAYIAATLVCCLLGGLGGLALGRFLAPAR